MNGVMYKPILICAGLLALTAPAWAARAAQQQPPEQPRAQRPAPKLTVMETVRRHLQRFGATIDETKSQADMVVSSYSNEKGKVKIVIVNDRRKELLQFYVYNFGSVKDAINREEIDKYLLLTNESLPLGAFFVDKEQDIGYKYSMSSLQLTYTAFASVYSSIVVAANLRRPEIRKLLAEGSQGKQGDGL
jgi:hypothetical protein